MTTQTAALSPAARAFDAIAEEFDLRYGGWRSVAAQRRAVRTELVDAFPMGSRVLEIGGGTGDDALWLARNGRSVLSTDASPRMVECARRKFADTPGARVEVVAAEDLERLSGEDPFDGAFSNFAGLNCIADLLPVARGLARLLQPGAPLILVLFGPFSPGELAVQFVRGSPASAFRRLGRGERPARLGGRDFTIRYHRPREIAATFGPWFQPFGRRGIGIFVPPSAAEPWISRHPGLLRLLEGADRAVSRPLALLGDHVLYRFRRTGEHVT